MTPRQEFIDAGLRHARIAAAIIDCRTASAERMLEAARAAMELDAWGDRWAAEIVRIGEISK